MNTNSNNSLYVSNTLPSAFCPSTKVLMGGAGGGSLSILIPTHDYTCYKLVYDLHEQAEALDVPYEIIVAEDGSRSPVNIIANHKIIDLSNCRHIQRKENVGRAKIRNVLMRESKGNLLLFMDSDGKVIRPDFLKKYIDASGKSDVVCGGMKCPDVCYDPHKQLRWKYEREYERKFGCISEQFRSFCFMITRKVADTVKFDERYSNYGYEDVQYGKDLKAAGFTIMDIDNPLENKDIEDSDVFLRKTEQAMQSAYKFRNELCQEITVVSIYNKVRACKIVWLVKLLYYLFHRPIKSNLLSKDPSLFLFKFYKLGYFSSLKN